MYAHVGVLTTALGASNHDIQPFLVTDAVADFSGDDHRLAMEYAAQRCAVVATTGTVVAALEPSAATVPADAHAVNV